MLPYLLIGLLSLSALHAQETNEAQPTLQTVAAQEKPVLLLYYKSNCPYCHVVLNYLEEIHHSIPTRNLDNNPKGVQELKKAGGFAQVPCLMIDGKALYESTAIVEWLSQHKDLLD